MAKKTYLYRSWIAVNGAPLAFGAVVYSSTLEQACAAFTAGRLASDTYKTATMAAIRRPKNKCHRVIERTLLGSTLIHLSDLVTALNGEGFPFAAWEVVTKSRIT